MKNIKRFLAMVFQDISVSDILSSREMVRYNQLDSEFVLKLMEHRQPNYSRNELRAQIAYFQSVCETYNEKWSFGQLDRIDLDIFSLMFYYVSRFLTFQGNEICCKYADLLHWRMLTLRLSEDMLICAFLADHDAVDNTQRTIFDWPVVIGHNNTELNMILNRGMAENHFHLKGSAPSFYLAWSYLMNNKPTDADREKFSDIDRTSRKIVYSVSHFHQEEKLETQILQAAAIRMYLFRRLMKIPAYRRDGDQFVRDHESIAEFFRDFHGAASSERMVLAQEKIYEWINDLRMLLVAKGTYLLDDYAVIETYPDGRIRLCDNSYTYPTNSDVYRGERHFLYLAFMAIRLNYILTEWEKNLFFAYLVIRERFRSELLQINYEQVGFENFSIFEERKSFFTAGDILVKEAMKEILFSQEIRYLEARICPYDTMEGDIEQIQRLDYCIDPERKYQEKYGYIMHFVKKADESIRIQDQCTGSFICRHESLRKDVNRQGEALIQLREQWPDVAARVVGIDACNQEIGCRPEVFACTFRRLKEHMVTRINDEKNLEVPQLRITYHVGEDFLDLADGLRAIDEAINFLQMKCGDRLGHAIALGVDVEEWYQKKVKIILSCQDYMDNIVWVYFALSKYNIEGMDSLKTHLEEEFQILFNEIYRPFIHKEDIEQIVKKAERFYEQKESAVYYSGAEFKFDIYHYYEACQLRGDDPEYYIEGYFKNIISEDYRKMPYKVNWDYPEKFNTRMIPEVSMFYYYYHYDVNVKRAGSRHLAKKPNLDYIKAIKLIQQKMQKKIASLGICIEANPTSNYLIGTFKRYDKHPIIRWYNHNLETDPDKLARSPQLSVSINTDDMGVFSTKLSNEYSLMALALEMAQDENGKRIYDKNMVYRWIDDIRKFGLNQNFIHQNRKTEKRNSKEEPALEDAAENGVFH